MFTRTYKKANLYKIYNAFFILPTPLSEMYSTNPSRASTQCRFFSYQFNGTAYDTPRDISTTARAAVIRSEETADSIVVLWTTHYDNDHHLELPTRIEPSGRGKTDERVK